jgi:hypothetical protein
MPGAAPVLQALGARLPDHVAARSLNRTGRLGRRPVTAPPRTSAGGAASRRPPCAKPAYPRPRRARALSFPVARIWPPPAARDAVAAPASRASRTRPSSGWRCTRNVLRSASPGCRTAFRRCGSPGRPGSRRSAPAVAVDRSRISGPVQDHRTGRLQTIPEADGAPRNRRTMPAQTGMPLPPESARQPSQRPRTPRARHRRQVCPYGEQPARQGAGLPASSGHRLASTA